MQVVEEMLEVWKRPTVADIKAVISFATTSLTIKVKSCMNLVRALLIKKKSQVKVHASCVAS